MKNKITCSEKWYRTFGWIKMATLFILFFSNSFVIAQSWVQLNNIGTTISGTASSSPPVTNVVNVSLNGKIYVIGNTTFTSTNQYASLWEYDPLNDSWAQKSAYPGNGSSFLCGFSIGKFIYVGCGTGTVHACSDFYRYNTANNTWSAIASIPVPRTMAGAFSIGGKGYVTCGESMTLSQHLNDLWEYDTISNTWSQKANFPGQGRSLPSAFSAGGSGFTGFGYYTNNWTTDLYRYSPGTNTWSAVAAFPGQGRCAAGTIVVGNTMVLIGGNNAMLILNDSYLYHADANSWESFISYAGNATSMVCGNVGNRIFAGGGVGPGGATIYKDWWSLQSLIGFKENAAELGHVYVYKNAGNEIILKVDAPVTGKLAYQVFDIQGKQVLQGLITGNESILAIEVPGLYTVVFDSERIKPVKFNAH
jgi:N-acetylneuraminic acid mutarotase